MIKFFNDWFNRYFSDPQTVFLTLFLVIAFAIIINFSDILMPVFAAIVFAYLLEGIVRYISQGSHRRRQAVILVFLFFIAFIVFFLGLTPLLWQQVAGLFNELPKVVDQVQGQLLLLPKQYSFISEEGVRSLSDFIQTEINNVGQNIVQISFASIPFVISFIIYVILVPVLVFFFLKDKVLILEWFESFLPGAGDRELATQVWKEMNRQIGNYVRGKFWEIVIVGGVSFLTFVLFGLKFAALMAALVGLSVVVPFIGAAAVTVPITLIAYFQWGWGSDFFWLMTAYFVIQILDGNVLVPLIFSEVVNLHPIAIIVAVLFFGGLWGLWGVFFAIPLATLVNVLITVWPKYSGKAEVAENN